MPLFRRTKRWLLLVPVMLLSSILLVACGEGSPSIINPAGPVANSENGVFVAILIIATIVFVAVEGILIFSMIRFRERPGSPTPKQLHGNTKVEVAWTVIPALILFIVLGYTIRGLFEVATPPAGEKTLEVTAFAHQWWWEFYYPEYNITTADSLVVPANTVVNVSLYSNNVIHSFWVPELTGKTDVVPGHNNQRWFKADTPNKTYLGICAEYCGTQHANMRFNVVVDESNDFLAWTHTQQQAAVAPAAGSMAAKGAQVFKDAGCQACHGIVGVDITSTKATNPNPACDAPNAGPAQGCFTGPNLTHFGSRNFIAGGVLENNSAQCQDPNNLKDCNLAKWLHDPQGIKPGNDMAIGPLTDEQIQQLVAYLESLK
ncbi:cytochrome c oxidase subunit 2 [Reticulibacter mediterranei]|uniref:Cytochrome c oxidase subunit 2 n=1 Tax=Reticulibacter mediterranei TaxID=2778369 RepID=A0A8J3MZ67_9CHLR|nr:cytochrome c oxidase subunit II [Reticulibacter mediterranei]GHO92814.1 cytochrome c oxidase subunit 2 [Reticulibacter mediterranei]